MSLIAVPPVPCAAELKSRRGGPSVAVLVDSENFPAAFLGRVVEAAESIGRANIRKGFANCSSTSTQEWRTSPYALFAVTPVHVPTTTTGKNASDIALAMAAMDIAHLRLADVVCIASSDGDFSMLAHRLRELGVNVFGFGSAKSPPAWVAACDRFEVVYASEKAPAPKRKASAPKPAPATPATPATPAAAPLAADADLSPVIAAVESWMGTERVRILGPLGNVLKEAVAGFDPRKYGFNQLRKLVHALPGFEVIPGTADSPNAPRVRRTDEAPAPETDPAPPVAAPAAPAETDGAASEAKRVGGILITPMETVASEPEEPAVGAAAAPTQSKRTPRKDTGIIASLVEEFMGEASERDYSQFGILLRQRLKGFSPVNYGFRSQRALVSSLDGFDVEKVGMAGRKPILRLLRVGAPEGGPRDGTPVGAALPEGGAGAAEAPAAASVPRGRDEGPGSDRRPEILAVASDILAADPAVTPRQLWGRLRARYNTLTLAELGVESVRDLVAALPAPSETPPSAVAPDGAVAGADATDAKRPRRRAPRKPKGDA